MQFNTSHFSLEVQLAWESLIFNKAEELFPDAEIKNSHFIGLKCISNKLLDNNAIEIVCLPTKLTRAQFSTKTKTFHPKRYLTIEELAKYENAVFYCWEKLENRWQCDSSLVTWVVNKALETTYGKQTFQKFWKGKRFTEIRDLVEQRHALYTQLNMLDTQISKLSKYISISIDSFDTIIDRAVSAALDQIEDQRLVDMQKALGIRGTLRTPPGAGTGINNFVSCFDQIFSKFDKQQIIQNLLTNAIQNESNSYFEKTYSFAVKQFAILMGNQQAITLGLCDPSEDIRRLAELVTKYDVVKLGDQFNKLKDRRTTISAQRADALAINPNIKKYKISPTRAQELEKEARDALANLFNPLNLSDLDMAY